MLTITPILITISIPGTMYLGKKAISPPNNIPITSANIVDANNVYTYYKGQRVLKVEQKDKNAYCLKTPSQ